MGQEAEAWSHGVEVLNTTGWCISLIDRGRADGKGKSQGTGCLCSLSLDHSFSIRSVYWKLESEEPQVASSVTGMINHWKQFSVDLSSWMHLIIVSCPTSKSLHDLASFGQQASQVLGHFFSDQEPSCLKLGDFQKLCHIFPVEKDLSQASVPL